MRLARRLASSRMAVAGGVLVALFVLCGLLAPLVAPYDPHEQNLDLVLRPPGSGHWLGTDEMGRDLLSRIIWGSRLSLEIGVGVVSVGLGVGFLMGAAAGFLGGRVDGLMMRAIDVLMAFPTLLLALGLVAVIGPGLPGVIVAVGVASVPRFCRVVRAAVLAAKQADFVEAARAVGQRELLVLFRHVVPNCLAPMIVLSTLLVADAILISSGLGFLGLGVQAPQAEWGVMLSDGRAYLRVAPHVATFPGIAIMLSVLGFNLLGDGLRDALDVRFSQ